MWPVPAFLLFTITHTVGGTLFDVTTVYKFGGNSGPLDTRKNGQIHVRTNALGLSLYNGLYKYPGAANLTCDTSESVCSWGTKDWTKNPAIKINKAVPIKISKERVPTGLEYTAAFPFKLHFNQFKEADTSFFVLMSTDAIIQLQIDFLLVKLYTSDLDYRGYTVDIVIYTGCIMKRRSNYENDSKYASYHGFSLGDGSLLGRGPLNIVCKTKTSESTVIGYNITLTFNIDNNVIKVYDGDGVDHPLTSWTPLIPLNKNGYVYFSAHGQNLPHIQTSVAGLTASTEGSEIVSPAVTLDSSQLCLLLLFNSHSDCDTDVLQVLAQDVLETEHLLYSLNNIKAGWQVKHLFLTLPDKIYNPLKLKIRKIGTVKIDFGRIASCNPDGEEVEVLSSNILLFDRNGRYGPTIYTAKSKFLDEPEEKLYSPNNCLNGGVLTTDGCACPPGFYGSECQIGCGRNRFGQDCGGLCSYHPPECEGLLLCSQFTKCQCAPGYQGTNCTQACSAGRYGNDCAQRCGHCQSADCDVYTGQCISCEPGYHPPYCKQASVYYALQPVLSSPEYGIIAVSFNPSNYVSAHGEPVLYQVQCREQNGDWKIITNHEVDKNDDNSLKNVWVFEKIENLKAGTVYEVRVLLMDADLNKYDGELVQTSEILTKCYIPEQHDYKPEFTSNTSALTLSWSYINSTKYWCPLMSYEVSWKAGCKWTTNSIVEDKFTLTGFLPGSEIKFKVRAKTTGGFAPYSKIISASTFYNGTNSVRDLRVVSSDSASAQISWEAPSYTEDRNLTYFVTYECVDQPACSPGCHNATEGGQTVRKTSLVLRPLLPFARYLVTVTPDTGVKASIYITTSKQGVGQPEGAGQWVHQGLQCHLPQPDRQH